MQTRPFGSTQFDCSIFSLGMMRCLTSPSVAAATLHQAIAQGINHLETARGYGSSEVFLGTALAALPAKTRSQLQITSKILPTPDAATMAQQIDQSLTNLQTDRLDCLAIHGLNTPEHLAWVQAPQGCMAAVHQAIADGRIGQVGFSSHGSLELILAAIETDLFAFVNLHYSWFFQRNAPAIARAAEKSMAVFIISPADKGGLLYTPPPKLAELCQPFSPLALNYRFLWHDPRITTLSLGPAKPEELTEPLAIAQEWSDRAVSQLSATEQLVLDRLASHQATVLQADQCQQCYACLPCPEAIEIPEVLRLRNLAVAYDMTQFGEYRYRMFENAGHWFPGQRADRCTDCGDCLPRCPENLAIPRLLRDTHDRLKGQPRRRLWQDD